MDTVTSPTEILESMESKNSVTVPLSTTNKTLLCQLCPTTTLLTIKTTAIASHAPKQDNRVKIPVPKPPQVDQSYISSSETKKAKFYKACGLSTHSRISSKLCPKSKRYLSSNDSTRKDAETKQMPPQPRI